MHLIHGLLNYSANWALPDIVFFTSNQIVKRNGELVMGAGNAKAARDAIPNAAYIMGQAFRLKGQQVYAELVCAPSQYLGAFATKQHYKDNSSLEFVLESLKLLTEHAVANPTFRLHIPYPAIGNGGLTRQILDPYVFALPDNVYVYCN